MKYILFTLFIAAVVFVGCKSTKEVFSKAVLVDKSELTSISSGSAMSLLKSHFYIVGDDDPYLWKLSSSGQVKGKWQIWDTLNIENKRIVSKLKPDFEASTFVPYKNDSLLILLGSGSKSPNRDIIMTFHPKTFELNRFKRERSFFYDLKNHFDLTSRELNIEALAHFRDSLYIFNRHNNTIYSITKVDFFNYKYEETTTMPFMNSKHFTLPTLDSDTARFSGANFIDGTSLLLFSATIENTENWEKDGGIKGSFIGGIDFSTNKLLFCVPVQTKEGETYIGKIEGLYGEKRDNHILVHAITDNDDGSTLWLKIRVD